MTDAELADIENHACPGAGACGGQFTANTMATATEFLGISPMGSASVPATDPKKDEVGFQAGAQIMELVRRDLRPCAVLTRHALENAIASVAASGGSTHPGLHLLALAREAGIELSIDDFDRVSSRTPLLADLKPGGRFVATDLYRAGGIRLLAQRPKPGGVPHSQGITVTGKTVGEKADAAVEMRGQQVVRPLDHPLK